MKRWHNGHSTGFGILVGLGIAGYRPYLIFGAGILVGAFVAFVGPKLYQLGSILVRKLAGEFWHFWSKRRERESRERRQRKRVENAEIPF